MNIPDQKQMWNTKHGAGEHATHRDSPAEFVIEVEKLLPRSLKRLGFGCGVGSDSVYFAKQGHSVLATDFSEMVIEQNRSLINLPNVQFSVQDITAPLNYPLNNFDVVYAHLSIHYFDNETTIKIVQEIHKVLRQGGVFAFACKSVNDKDNANGEEVSPGLFVSKTGHARHFFTLEYDKELLYGLFEVKSLEEKEMKYFAKSSTIIYCIANKI